MADPPRSPAPAAARSVDARVAAEEDALLADVLARRDAGRDPGPVLGVLLERWRKPAMYVIRRVQQSYRAGTPDDADELYQEAAFKLVDRGLAQFKGGADRGETPDPAEPASSAAARVFFLRIVKHTAIDHYRRMREELARGDDGEAVPEATAPEIAVADGRARAASAREEAADLYWRAFERLRADHPGEAEAWEAYHHLDLDDHEACARRLGISVASSYKRVSRAQARLRLFLLELADADPPGDPSRSGRPRS